MLVIELIMKISSMQISVVACSSYKFSLSQIAVTNFQQIWNGETAAAALKLHHTSVESKMALRYWHQVEDKRE